MLLVTLLGVPGCGSKGAVTLTAQIQNPSLAVKSVALGTALEGSFDLLLDLGPEAPKATTVTPGSFALRNQQSVLVSTLGVTFSDAPPYEIAVGGSKTITVTLDASKLVEASVRDALCAGQVSYLATLSDTLTSNTSTTESLRFSPNCQ